MDHNIKLEVQTPEDQELLLQDAVTDYDPDSYIKEEEGLSVAKHEYCADTAPTTSATGISGGAATQRKRGRQRTPANTAAICTTATTTANDSVVEDSAASSPENGLLTGDEEDPAAVVGLPWDASRKACCPHKAADAPRRPRTTPVLKRKKIKGKRKRRRLSEDATEVLSCESVLRDIKKNYSEMVAAQDVVCEGMSKLDSSIDKMASGVERMASAMERMADALF